MLLPFLEPLKAGDEGGMREVPQRSARQVMASSAKRERVTG